MPHSGKDAQHGPLDRQPHLLDVSAIPGRLRRLAFATATHCDIGAGPVRSNADSKSMPSPLVAEEYTCPG
eukprot:1296230-Pleurochrysis_carterae.AAC.1